jgi:cytochrome c-type protein NapC
MKKNKKTTYWLGVVGGILLLTVVSWMAIETGIEISSHADFCGVCHAMEPMVDSYHDSIHGGNNPRGIMAACTDCHVSHENVFTHFAGKAQSGTHDAWVTLTRDESTLDWQAKRAEHNDYVYDSGCLTCHRNLEAATADKSFHDNYFNGNLDAQCVDCHAEVGHDNLNKYLLENKYKYHFDE